MKKFSLALLLGSVLGNASALPPQPITTSVEHHPVAMVGVTYSFDGSSFSNKNIGFSLNVLSSNQEEEWVLGAGATFFPWAEKQFGVGIGAGRNFKNSNCLVGWDFMKSAPTVTCGGTSTEPESKTSIPGPT